MDLMDGYIEKYSEVQGVIGGSASKNFYRIKSSYLKELIMDLRGSSNYVTHINNIVKEGYVPQHVSCMIKRRRANEGINPDVCVFNEVVGSRLADMFRIPTVFATDISLDKSINSVIVDFLDGNEVVEDFDEYAGKPNMPINSIQDWEQWFRHAIIKNFPHFTPEQKSEKLIEYMEPYNKNGKMEIFPKMGYFFQFLQKIFGNFKNIMDPLTWR